MDGNPFPGIYYRELSLKNHCVGGRDRKLNFIIFVVWSALIAGMWMVAWSRKYCLGSAEIESFLCLIIFKDGGHRVGPRIHLCISDINQENEEAG